MALKGPVAIVGPAVDGEFPVEFLGVPGADSSTVVEAREAACRELDLYLVELDESDPWAYAIYHAGTAANAYSSVH